MADRPRVRRALAILGCLFGLLCTPPVAEVALALEPLHREDVLPLWLFSLALVLLGVWIGTGTSRWRSRAAAITLPVLLLTAVELVARLSLSFASPATRNELVQLARRTYRDTMAYQPHPFLQFTGNPGVALQGNNALGGLPPFNALGFHDPLPDLEKPPDTLRIACLGGSTTARGYPGRMRALLQQELREAQHIEVINQGLGWYSSEHSVVNFVLNTVDYSPDYVVFHHAWNDREARDRGSVRGDYRNAYRPFRYPEIRDALLLRGSVVYRWLKHRLRRTPDFAFLDRAVVAPRPDPPEHPYRDVRELAPFRRNVRTIVDLALARGIVPVITTQPHSTDPDIGSARDAPHIDQCNAILREEAERYGDRVLFVDLDGLVTGVRDEFFVDLGHMNGEGIEFKARAIGDAILEHWRLGRAAGSGR